MNLSIEELKYILVRPGYISGEVFSKISAIAGKDTDSFIKTLIEKELINDFELAQLIAGHFGYKFINLREEKIDENLLKILPEAVSHSLGAVPFGRQNNKIKVGMIDPGNLDAIHILEKRYQALIEPFMISKRDLMQALEQYKSDIKEKLEKQIYKYKNNKINEIDRDQFVLDLVDKIMHYGFHNKASDIHIEPMREHLLIRYRIDGVLHPLFNIPLNLAEPINMRIKILSKMRTDEHFSAQDGRFCFEAGEGKVDVRVSIVPVSNGEKIVMRLLSSEGREIGISHLGFSEIDLKKLEEASKHPHGMILVTGPTGCGKTTTLYGILRTLNNSDVNIATIEDPVEYNIEGVNQIQVNPKTNLSFAAGLRAIVRQDPDIIMVGEIRDEETAEIAVNSAMTGHLVLSTLHANNAITALPRLIDMKIEPYLITSTVNIIIAQRLVRKMCPKCRSSYLIGEDEKKLIESHQLLKQVFINHGYDNFDNLRLYKSVGCKACASTGFTGRIGIFELLTMDDGVKELVIKRSSSFEIEKAARESGMTTILEDGIDKVINGITTLGEVIRVTEIG
jgi:type IV pilus assembly protein PilB